MRLRATIWFVILWAVVAVACSGSGSSTTGPETASSGGQPGGAEGGAGGGGGSGGGGTGGGSGISLSTTQFRVLDVTSDPSNGGTVSDNFAANGSAIQNCTACQERYRLGTRLVLTATPRPGFTFDRWQGTDCHGSPRPTCSLVIDHSARVGAIFRR